MRIARICRSLIQPAGTERSIVESSFELSERGADVRIYTPVVDYRLFGGLCRQLDIEEVRVPLLPFFDLYSDLLIAKRLIAVASTWADVIILHHGHATASYAKNRYSIPCIPFFHCDNRDWSLYGSLRPLAPLYVSPLNALEARTLQHIPLIFANSRDLSSRIREYAPSSNVIPITLGVNTNRFYPNGRVDEEFALMSGRFHPTNNFELGLTAIERAKWKLTIAGVVEKKFVMYYDSLRRRISEKQGLEERVLLATPSESWLVELLQRCSVFLSPRKYSYLGRAALEAMACGRPVIAYKVKRGIEGSPPVLQCGDDPNEWAQAINHLMNNRGEREKLGRAGHEFVTQSHTLKKSVDQMTDAIRAATYKTQIP